MNWTNLDNQTDLMPSMNYANISLKEWNCYLSAYNHTLKKTEQYCNSTWDGLSCWPVTSAGKLAVISCFEELQGIPYDTNQTASRMCEENGTWAERSDYLSCLPLIIENQIAPVLWEVEDATTVYFFGHSLSLAALVIALGIFFHFKELRCLRNTIHINLMITYVLHDLIWIIVASLQTTTSPINIKVACFLLILLTYLTGTNFFWMFVEGLYLYILVVKTFFMEMKFYIYVIIGWGLPAVIVITWATVKIILLSDSQDQSAEEECFWRGRDDYDYIFMCPIIIVLAVNIYFLARIMWVLITKLRAATTAESKQYRKASKALLVLIPLLGITYIVVLVRPSQHTADVLFSYIQAILLSTQGLTVAILYCFLNGEVRNCLRHYLTRRRLQKTLRSIPRSSINSQQAENLRLYPSRAIRDQDSLETTDSWISSVKEKSISEQRPSNGCL